MKKLLPLLLLLLTIAVGCNKETVYKENLDGTWVLYKYLLYNVDKTQLYQARYPNDTIWFTNGGNFSQLYYNPDSSLLQGTYTFIDNDEKLRLIHTYNTYSYNYIYDSTGVNIIDSTQVATPHEVKRDFTIFNLTRDHVQLRTDTSQMYLRKDVPKE